MSMDWLVIAVLVALYLLLKNGRLGPRIVMAMLGARGLAAVGRMSLASQPDELTLELAPGDSDPRARELGEALLRRGFLDGGRFSVREMAGVHVSFLVKPDDAVVAAIYEHAKAGAWCDLNTGYSDGSSFTITSTQMGASLEDRPGHPIVRAPGAHPAALHVRLLRERPAGAMLRVETHQVAEYFADAYATSMAWRKQRGVTVEEVRGAAVEV